MKKNLINCLIISVDCVPNESVDIRFGGPQFLGFDFIVEEENVQEMKMFIIMSLQNFGIPLINICISKKTELPREKIWTKKKILEAIISDMEYLKSEQNSQNYEHSYKTK